MSNKEICSNCKKVIEDLKAEIEQLNQELDYWKGVTLSELEDK
jgi:hypothetical protein